MVPLFGVRGSSCSPASVLIVGLLSACLPTSSLEIADSTPAGYAGPPARSGVSETSARRLGVVIETLSDIFASIESDEKQEQASFTAFMQWCSSEQEAVGEALTKARQESAETEASATELEATVEHLKQVLDDSADEIKDAKDTISQAVSLREEEEEKHTEDMQLNRQSIDQVTAAISILGKVHGEGSGGFLQSSAAAAQHQRRQQQQRSGYPGESGYILGIMKGLHDGLQQTRHGLETSEAAAKSRHDALVGSEKLRVEALQQTIADKTAEHTQARMKFVEAQRLGDKLKAQVSELSTVIADVTRECAAKPKWWSVRVEDRGKEKSALHEAIDFLRKFAGHDKDVPDWIGEKIQTPTSFLQTRSASGVASRARAGNGHSALLTTATAQLSMFAAGVGVTAKSHKHTLDSAKKVVEDLIGVLQTEQQDEAQLKTYCERELGRKGSEQASLRTAIDELNATIQRKTAETELLAAEVSSIEGELESMRVRLENATAIRKADKALYEAGKKDRALAIKVLAQAKAVLNKFYASGGKDALIQAHEATGGAEFVPQSRGSAKPIVPSGSTRKTLASEGVIILLEKLAAEIAKEQNDAANEEQEAAAAYERLQVDSRAEFDDQIQVITDRVKVKAKTLVHIGSDKEVVRQKTEDQTAVGEQLGSLHGQCDELLASFEQRTTARSFELSQLRDVVDILSGSRLAPRTGPSESSDALDATENALLQDMSRAAVGLRG